MKFIYETGVGWSDELKTIAGRDEWWKAKKNQVTCDDPQSY